MDKKRTFSQRKAAEADSSEQPAGEVFMGITAFDPELLYVECAKCGQPVLWSPGDTTKVLTWAGIDARTLDEKCMIVSEGCPLCRPDQRSFSTQVVRLRTGQAMPVPPKNGHGSAAN